MNNEFSSCVCQLAFLWWSLPGGLLCIGDNARSGYPLGEATSHHWNISFALAWDGVGSCGRPPTCLLHIPFTRAAQSCVLFPSLPPTRLQILEVTSPASRQMGRHRLGFTLQGVTPVPWNPCGFKKVKPYPKHPGADGLIRRAGHLTRWCSFPTAFKAGDRSGLPWLLLAGRVSLG